MFNRLVGAIKRLFNKLRGRPRSKVDPKPVIGPPQPVEPLENDRDGAIKPLKTRKTFSDMEWEEGPHTPREDQEMRLAARMSEAAGGKE
ncbi:MAG: hypothetical protein M1831_002128 [Alyxoria varia]|nr:MAG: hypothetical protein M1831_002128 [Alyxoria varia]